MKSKNRNHWGGAFSLVETLIVIAMIGLFAALMIPKCSAANYIQPQGLYINGTTNTVNVGGVNDMVGVVLPGTTNYFNLTGANQSQANTNLWPKLGITIGKDEGTPSRQLAVGCVVQSGLSSDTTTFIIYWAPSTDATHWLTNSLYPQNIVMNGLSPVATGTNFDSGGYPFWTVYAIANTNASATAYKTNFWLGSASKPLQ